VANTVQCSFCGNMLRVPKGVAGGVITCSACGQPTAFSVASSATQMARLRVKKGELLYSGHKRCPTCDSTVDETAAMCGSCGFDWHAGKKRVLPKRRGKRFPGWAVFLIIAAAGVGAGVLFSRYGDVLRLPKEPEPPAVVPAPQPRVKTADEWARDVARSLDQKYPKLAKGAEADLRLADGQTHRGVIAMIGDDKLILIENQQMVHITFATLDDATRLRCDDVFRAKYLDSEVRKRMAADSRNRAP
jgi:hypothetical protein